MATNYSIDILLFAMRRDKESKQVNEEETQEKYSIREYGLIENTYRFDIIICSQNEVTIAR